jgi:hypothetical protein
VTSQVNELPVALVEIVTSGVPDVTPAGKTSRMYGDVPPLRNFLNISENRGKKTNIGDLPVSEKTRLALIRKWIEVRNMST